MSFISLRSYLQIIVLKILNIIIWLLQIILNWRKINIYFSGNFYRNENSQAFHPLESHFQIGQV